MKTRGNTSEAAGLLALAATGMAAIALFRAPGTTDVTTYWLPWIATLQRYGVVDGYARIGSDYPPLSSALLSLSSVVGARFWAGPDAPFLGLKLLLLVFWAATVAVTWRLIGPRDWRALDTALVGAALLLNAVAMAYLDILIAPACLLAFGALRASEQTSVSRHRLRLAFASGLCLSFAVWTKWQPAVILPFVAVYVIKRGKPEVRGVGWAMVVFALAMLAIFGSESVLALRRAMLHSSLSAQMLNLNWIVQYFLVRAVPGLNTLPDAGGEALIVYGPGRAVRFVATALLAVTYLSCLARYIQHGRTLFDLLTAALTGFLCYVTFAMGVHENHPFILVLLAASLLILEPAARRLVALLAVIANLNLVVFYGLLGQGLGFSRVFGIDLTLVLAAVEVGAFLALYFTFLSRVGSTLQTTDK